MSEHEQHDKQITKDILKNIEKFGVHIPFIESDGYAPSFGYSIGLYKGFSHPELIVIGLDFDSTGSIINHVKSDIEKGTKFISDVNYPGYLVNWPIQFTAVEKAHYPDYLGYAGWYNGNSVHFPTLQIVWPDNKGIFPWEDDFNQKFIFKQPLLDRNTDFKFLENRNLAVFTTAEVLNRAPIRFVYHDEDGSWQFHSEKDPDLTNGKLVCLEDLVKMDPTLNEIYYLNFGESAERDSPGEAWRIFS